MFAKSNPKEEGSAAAADSTTEAVATETIATETVTTEAVTRGAGLADDCYELAVLGMFRREYVAALPKGGKVLADYRNKAARITHAIQELSGENSTQEVWECVYAAWIVPGVLLITRGAWDEAYELYRSMYEELEEVFVAGDLAGYSPESWPDDWIRAKLAATPVEALASAGHSPLAGEAADYCGVVPLENRHPDRDLS